MTNISDTISKLNNKGEKALTAYVTAGIPDQSSFVDTIVNIVNTGADIIEIGVPFSDPLADGSVIQASSFKAAQDGVTLEKIFAYTSEIKAKSNVPIILMGYANPILKHGKEKFTNSCLDSGVDGIIVPDAPINEYNDFYKDSFSGIDNILLTTPTSTDERIKLIDEKSEGFVYCVSVTGTTGFRKTFSDDTFNALDRTYKLVTKNKVQIGFGISSGEIVKQFSPYCDGVIVGTSIVKNLMSDNGEYKTLKLIEELKNACVNN